MLSFFFFVSRSNAVLFFARKGDFAMFACDDDDIIESFLRSIPQMRVNAVIKQTNMRNKCFSCSQGGHYVSECPLRYPNHKKTSHCNRCGRHSHTITNCRAQLHINGKKLEKESLFFS